MAKRSKRIKPPDLDSVIVEIQPNSEEARARYEWTLFELYDLADSACQEIIAFNPELLIVLAHGGWGALWALQALWGELYDAPLPEVLVTNLGREKIRRYEAIRSTVPCTEISPFVADFAGDFETGYFLAWLSRQTDWQDALRSQVLEALAGQMPERILVLDDTVWEGGTYRLVLGLLRDIFPACQVHMLAGDMLDWRAYIPTPWLQEHGLALDGKENREKQGKIYHLAPGTEDLDAENSLGWKPVTADGPILTALTSYLPAETWLELPGHAERIIREGVLAYRQEVLARSGEHSKRVSAPALSPVELVIKQVWLRGKVTRREAAADLNISPEKAGGLLARMVRRGRLVAQGRARGVHYVLPPDAITPHAQRLTGPMLNAYWVVPGQLMVGDPINGSDQETAVKEVEWLLSQGICCWINLDERKDPLDDIFGVDPKEEAPKCAEEILAEVSKRFGIKTTCLSLPLPFRRKPQEVQMQEVISSITRVIACGQPVYVYAWWSDILSTVAGCFLASGGMTGKQALEALDGLRQNTDEGWRKLPVSRWLRKMVRNWGEGK